MAYLSDAHRSLLEKVCVEARSVSETGARAALESLGVERSEPYGHLGAEERDLRVRLRARARQLGDKRLADGRHEIQHLVEEAAYEQWHRMLFARFLAENNLLMHPEHGVPVSLEECEELAEQEDAADGWELAARYAARMLPQIFRRDAPALELDLAPEHEQKLEYLLESLPAELFRASDALGWVYQYWQSEKKDEVNKSEVKIGADELAPVTQLFTEPYMVQFLLHNSLGAWWTSRHPDADLPVELTYLRTLDDGTPAAGTFDGWPETAAELKVLDPCCGSGHFLVEAFRLLVPMRMHEEGLSAQDAGDTVLRDNLYGLELDARCTEIAAFALAMAAWSYPGADGYRELPELNIACSGLAVGASKKDWERFGGRDERLKAGMGQLWELFKDAPTLGSLIDPTRGNGDLFVAGYEELKPLLQKALEEEDPRDYEGRELGVTAQGMAKAAQLLADKYHLVTTNVPYLSRGKQDPKLRKFCEKYYGLAKQDLATVFLQRCLSVATEGGVCSAVLPQNWLFLKTYSGLRRRLLETAAWHTVAILGSGAFRAISGEVVKGALITLGSSPPLDDPTGTFLGFDVTSDDSNERKAASLSTADWVNLEQHAMLANPGARITLQMLPEGPRLEAYASSLQGISPADVAHYGRCFWELSLKNRKEHDWVRWQSSVSEHTAYGGRQLYLWMNDDLETAVQQGKAYIRGQEAWGRKGVAVRAVGDLPATLSTGDRFDTNVAVVVPTDPNLLPAIWAFCTSPEYERYVRILDKKLNVTNATLVKVPFDVERWRAVAEEEYPDGLPEPYSEDPTQWIFRGTVTPSEAPLQVAVARLLGYHWPEQVEDGLDDLVDEDGIVCIPPVRGEQPAADRMRQVLSRAYGDDWTPGLVESLLADVGYEGKSLDNWLRNGFFQQHHDLFQKRPFIWHIWDGRAKDGFHALVNYHQLDHKRLEALTYSYLGDWIRRQQDELKQEKGGAEGRLEAAKDLQRRLELILEGEPPYDIFVRWKPIEEQPIGWEPDRDDGVRLNIRPFMEADVLRRKPRIHWKKDRGKDPEEAPWYHLFEGTRINDHHLSREEKLAARNAVAEGE